MAPLQTMSSVALGSVSGSRTAGFSSHEFHVFLISESHGVNSYISKLICLVTAEPQWRNCSQPNMFCLAVSWEYKKLWSLSMYFSEFIYQRISFKLGGYLQTLLNYTVKPCWQLSIKKVSNVFTFTWLQVYLYYDSSQGRGGGRSDGEMKKKEKSIIDQFLEKIFSARYKVPHLSH